MDGKDLQFLRPFQTVGGVNLTHAKARSFTCYHRVCCPIVAPAEFDKVMPKLSPAILKQYSCRCSDIG
ncbi:hypothetical protein FHS92_002183 [Sphingobium subterraneum]|uniref:Uncharacterized protein n=1 Tax=Sphingobium subterraneum TaxID=627688 RepID=A0A841J7A6_9SPHN|nr:hypothetical protein [Sphingobium subterraneum]